MRTIQWPLATLACFSMLMAPTALPCYADDPPAATRAALPGVPPSAVKAKAAAPVDLSYVPASAVGGAGVPSAADSGGRKCRWMPVEVITAAGLQYAGFDPVQIQEAIAVVAPPRCRLQRNWRRQISRRRPVRANRRPASARCLHFAQAYSRRDGVAKLKPMKPVIQEVDGKKFAMLPPPIALGVFMPDDQTLVVGTDGFLQQMIAAKGVDSDLTQARAGDRLLGHGDGRFFARRVAAARSIKPWPTPRRCRRSSPIS